jgi:Pentapeptide repeats (9 copies)
MGDVFFDLGKKLPQIDNVAMHAHLVKNREVFEKVFTPSANFEPLPGKTYAQIKNKRFDRVRFFEVRFRNLTFRECVFDKCLFLSAEFHDCEFHECSFLECNTNKIKFYRTYISPSSFLKQIFDKKKYSNIGVDLFQSLLRNSVQESQPEFKSIAEYHFRLWKRYNDVHHWVTKSGTTRWTDFRFYLRWMTNVASQAFSGYGLRVSNVLISTFAFLFIIALCNHLLWEKFNFDPGKFENVSYISKLIFFTVGTLSNFGTNELTPRSEFGLLVVSIEVLLGLAWIAISTAMLVKRVLR